MRIDGRSGFRALPALVAIAMLAGCAADGVAKRSAPTPEEESNQHAASLQVKLGQGYLAQGELETARDKLQRALELDPTSVDANTVMAVLQERIGRHEVAEVHYRRAVKLKPDGGAVNNNLGTFLCGLGRYDEAQKHFAEAVKDPFYRTPTVAYANSGFCAQKQGDLALAERSLRSALELDPGNALALFELARLSLQGGDPMRARAFLQRFEAIAGVEAAALALGAEVESRLGDTDAAERYQRLLQDKFPGFDAASVLPAAVEAESPSIQ